MTNEPFTTFSGLAQVAATWQGRRMAEPSSPRAGGAIVALCVIAGAVAGTVMRQTSIGILAGTAIGAAIAIAVWRADRNRRN